MKLLMSPKEIEKLHEIKRQVGIMSRSMAELSTGWSMDDEDTYHDYLTPNYPFNNSFDELAMLVCTWNDNLPVHHILIGEKFTEMIIEDLSDLILGEIRRKNLAYQLEGNGECCATHDFCDANVVMSDAFESVMGYEVDPQDEQQAKLWGEAWDYAKIKYLTEPYEAK